MRCRSPRRLGEAWNTMREGQVYTVRWQESDGLYRLTLARKSSVTVTSATIDAGLDELAGHVIDLYGDGEPQWRLEPRLPVPPGLAHFERYVILSADAMWETAQPVEELFEGTRCRACRTFFGRRNSLPLRLSVRHGRGSIATSLPAIGFTGMLLTEDWVPKLPRELLEAFTLVPAEAPRTVRKRWLELQPRWAVHEVLWSSHPHLHRLPTPCKTCGALKPTSYAPGGSNPKLESVDARFVRETDVPEPRPASFALRGRNNWTLAVRESLWNEIGTLSLFREVFDDVACCVLPDSEIASVPDRCADTPMWPALADPPPPDGH